MGICTCNNKTIAILQSELFVPRFDVTVDKVHQKKLLKLKTLVSKDFDPKNFKSVSTEKFIYSKSLYKAALSKGVTFTPDIATSKKKITNLEKMHSFNASGSQLAQMISRSKYLNSVEEQKQQDNTEQIYLVNSISGTSGTNNVNHILTFKNQNPQNSIQCEIEEQVFSSSEEMYIANVLLRHYLFNRATNEQINALISEMNEYQIDGNSYIFYEGEEGGCLFLLKKGKIELSTRTSPTTVILKEGDIFGELALFKEEFKRMYNARSITSVEFYIIDYNSCSSFLETLRLKANYHFELFDYLDNPYKEIINLLCSGIEFRKGHFITELNGILGIESGEFCVFDSKSGEEKTFYSRGEIVGLKEILTDNRELYDSNKLKLNFKFGENTRLIANDITKCSIIPIMAFIETFGLDYQEKILNEYFTKIFYRNYFFYQIFKEDYDSSKFFPLFQITQYNKDDILYRRKEDNDKKSIILVLDGFAEFVESPHKNKSFDCDSRVEARVRIGHIIGEEFVNGQKMKGDAIVLSERLLTLECPWLRFKQNVIIFNSNLQECIIHLGNMFLFNHVAEWKIIEALRLFKYENFALNDKIIPLGKKNEKVYFIKSGSVKFIVDNKTVRQYREGNSFGEIFLFNEREATFEIVVSSNNTKFFTINRENYFSLMENPKLNNFTRNKLCLEDIEIFPNTLYYLGTIARRKYHNIYIVHNKLCIYAIKAISIAELNKTNQKEMIITKIVNERKLIKRLNHPFIIQYVKTLKIPNWCLFLEEYIHGMNLQDYIESYKPTKNIKVVKFYAGCLFIMLDVLSKCGIVHRNIKPENIVINVNGYPRLIDFSTGKRIKSKQTKTLIGTPLFIAPEVLKGIGYSFSCDYWSVGITLYYLFYGEFPFGTQSSQVNTVYNKILNQKISFKKGNDDIAGVKEFNTLLEGLLNKNPNERICSFDKVQKESFFNGFNWDELVRRRIKPPFIPQITKLNEEKLLNNLMHKFVSFLEKDSIEHGSSLNINEATTSGLEIHSNNNAANKHDKTIVMTRLEEIDETWRSKLDAHTRKNWFEDF